MIKDYTFFFSDMVSYSSLVQRDESLALCLLDEHNQILSNSIDKYKGSVVKFIGDAVFAKFNNPNDACLASIDIQNQLRDRNSISRNNECINVRIGIHCGTAVERNNDLFGNEVNIASRVESVTESGSIFLTNNVLKKLNNQSNFSVRKVQFVKLKNISKPQILHKLYLNEDDYKLETTSSLINILIENGVDVINASKYKDYGIHSIGVLQFDSIDNEYLAYTLTNDIISDFDKINKIYVSDIQDVIKYKATELSNVDVARKLQVDNIIDGVCRIDNEKIFISIRMTDLVNNKILWKEDITDSLINVNIIKAKIINKVLEIFHIDVPDFILNNMSIAITDNTKAYKLYQKALYKNSIIKNKDDFKSIRSLFRQAINEDANFVESLAQYAITSNKLGFIEESEEAIDSALDKAELLGNKSSKANVLDKMGILYKSWYRYKKALSCFNKALKIEVEYEDRLAESKTLTNISGCYTHLNEPDKSIDVLKKSIFIKERLGKDRLLASAYGSLGNAYRGKLLYFEALDSYRKALGKYSQIGDEYNKGQVLFTLGRCYADIGEFDNAKVYVDKSEKICMKFERPLILGRIKQIQSLICISNKNYQIAFEKLDESIEYFNDAELRRPILDSLFEIIFLKTLLGDFDNFENIIAKYIKLARKEIKSGDSINFILIFLKLYEVLNCKQYDLNLESLEEFLDSFMLCEEKYIGWWLLAKIANTTDVAKEKYYFEKAKNTIDKFSGNTYEEEYRHLFINSNYKVLAILS